MVKDHSDSKKGNPLPPHRLLLSINSKGSFICTIPDRIAHTTAFDTPVMGHWLEREIVQWVHPMKDQSDDPLHHERTLLPWSYISLTKTKVIKNPYDSWSRRSHLSSHSDGYTNQLHWYTPRYCRWTREVGRSPLEVGSVQLKFKTRIFHNRILKT